MEGMVASLRDRAAALGFDACGIAPPHPGERAQRDFRAWLAAGQHGTMAWMSDTADRRADPRALWPDVQAVIVVGLSYAPGGDPRLRAPERGEISVYARGRDYHDILKKRLKALARWLGATHGGDVKVFTDTAPVLEKPLARRAGVGWTGKHTNLVSRTHGSWLFLGEVFTTLPLPPDTAETDHCGTCRRCAAACPTDALHTPYRMDVPRCLAYLTIEHAGPVPRPFRPALGNRVYGCDDCLAVCPWNKFAPGTGEPLLRPRAEALAPRLQDLAALDDAAFREVFSTSPVKRVGRDKFLHNVLIAVGNSGDPALAPVAERHLADPHPLVRAGAVWALGRLLPESDVTALARAQRPAETDPRVLEEWAAPGAAW